MTFGILGNTYSSAVPGVVSKFLKDLRSHGLDIAIEKKLYKLIGVKSGLNTRSVKSAAKLIRESDFIVSFGGDGTFLSTAKLIGDSGKPIIGVNLGKLGFLADIKAENAV